ncbi:MAG TPA: hypothetical protein VL359_00110, partial [bacterium]|nr:hypothetical protein [bacterium]
SITVGLTPQGLQEYQQVLEQVLGTIRALRERGIPRYIFDQNQVMAELAFRYQERQESAQLAEQTSAQMQIYPLDQIPEAPYLLTDYDPAAYERFLGAMTPDNMLVTLLAKGLPANRVEPYYQARYAYRQEPGPPYQELLAAQPDPRWQVPQPNPYIPRQAALLTPRGPLRIADSTLYYLQADGAAPAVRNAVFPYLDTTFPDGQALVRKMRSVLPADAQRHALPLLLQDSLALPTPLLDTDRARVWYLPDWRFRQPKSALLLKFYTANAFRTPRDVVLAQLYEIGIEEALDEFGYPVKQAGLDYDFTTLKSGLLLTLGGYSPHMLDVLQDLAVRMRNVDVTPQVFAALKDGYR